MASPEKSSAWDKMSPLEKIKSLREQQNTIIGAAKVEALEAAEKAVADLNSLGFDYRLVEGSEKVSKVIKSETVKRQSRDLPCSICGFKTEPAHDGRMHRSQATKKPFTAIELKERLLVKVDDNQKGHASKSNAIHATIHENDRTGMDEN
jgi:hypothetical protein